MKTLKLADSLNFYCKDKNEPGPAAYKKLPPNCIKMHEII